MAVVLPRKNQMAEVAEHSNVFSGIFKHAACGQLQNISMNAGSLPPPSPSLRLFHIAIGRGTQVREDLVVSYKANR